MLVLWSVLWLEVFEASNTDTRHGRTAKIMPPSVWVLTTLTTYIFHGYTAAAREGRTTAVTLKWHAYLLYLAVGADDERQPVREFAHEGDVELRAVQVGNVRADVRQERELEAVRLLEVEVLIHVHVGRAGVGEAEGHEMSTRGSMPK